MDVIIYNLLTKVKTKIRVKKFILKLAIFKKKVAVMLKTNILIYEITNDEEEIIKTPLHSITWEGETSLILLTSNHLVLCHENRIQLVSIMSTNGISDREWTFDGEVTYLKVLGGPANRESLVCGLNNGEVYIINIDNQFPVLIYNHQLSVKILDVSCERRKLAIIDDNSDLIIVDIKSKDIILKDQKAKSVAFNSDLESVVSYWNEGNVYIKTEDFPHNIEKMNGIIVGFKGTKVFLLQGQNNVNILDTSQSTSIIRYSEIKEFTKAYKLASLGATREEWLFLGFEALVNLELKVALNCFMKLEDMRLINLIIKVEVDITEKVDHNIIKGEIKCFKGDYEGAEASFIEGKCVDRAIEMWSMLTMFDRALELKKKYGGGKSDPIGDKLLLKQAEWLLENGKFLESADLFILLNKRKKALEIYGEHGYLEKLIEILRTLNKDEHFDLISLCGHYFKQHKNYQYATEAYLKLGDLKSLVIMNIELEKWEEAFYLSKQSKPLLEYTHLQWADNRIKKDLYKEAQDSYKRAGRIDLSMKLLENLIENAVYEKRFKDAASLLFLFSTDAEKLITNYSGMSKKEAQSVKLFTESLELVDIFNAYDLIYKYIEEPFSADLLCTEPIWIFNACKYLLNKITNFKFNLNHIKGISIAYVYYAAAFLSKQQEANKTSRFCFEKLNSLHISKLWKTKIDFEIMTIRAKPYTDAESQMPLCFRCLSVNPLINLLGDRCTSCSNPFIRSPISYEILPLIEFKIPENMKDNQAKDLISTSKALNLAAALETKGENNQGVIFFKRDPQQQEEDLFESRLLDYVEMNVGNKDYGIIVCDDETLKSMKESEVFIVDARANCPTIPVRYFKNRMKDIFINMCKSCFKFFRSEEWENYTAKSNRCCPICKAEVV